VWLDTAYVKAPTIHENDTFGFSLASHRAAGPPSERSKKSGDEFGPQGSSDRGLSYSGAV